MEGLSKLEVLGRALNVYSFQRFVAAVPPHVCKQR